MDTDGGENEWGLVYWLGWGLDGTDGTYRTYRTYGLGMGGGEVGVGGFMKRNAEAGRSRRGSGRGWMEDEDGGIRNAGRQEGRKKRLGRREGWRRIWVARWGWVVGRAS
jgi:hypothetical protein